MPIRRACSRVLMSAAGAARRLSHGLLFLAGGVRRLDDFKREAAAHYSDFNDQPAEIDSGFNALEARMYRKAVRPGARVCVIGCGTGRDLLPFVAAGHDVVGIEPALAAVERLRATLASRGAAATIVHGFVEDVALPGSFDAMVLSPHCYSYIPGRSRRVAILRKLADHLGPDGRIAINFLRRTGAWSASGVSLAAAAARLTGSDCPWEPHDIVQMMERDGRRTLMFEHFFSPDEISGEIAAAGLRVIDSEVDDFLGPLTIAGR